MSDRFEEAVRAAATRLGEPAPAPGYEQAYHRGTARLHRKRVALGAMCAMVLVGGLAVGGRLDGFGSTTIETDEVAIPADAEPVTPVADETSTTSDDSTTGDAAGVGGGTAASDDDAAESDEATGQDPLAGETDRTPDNGRGSRSDPAGASVSPAPFAPTPTVTAQADPDLTVESADDATDDDEPAVRNDQPPAPTATTEPTATQVPTPIPTPTATPAAKSSFTFAPAQGASDATDSSPSPTSVARPSATATVASAPTAASVVRPRATATVTNPPTGAAPGVSLPATTSTPLSTSTPTPTSTPATSPTAAAVVAPTATQPQPPPTASLPGQVRPDPPLDSPITLPGSGDDPLVPQILEEARFDRVLPCDIDGDGSADGGCTLLQNFPCTSATRVTSDYELADTDGDRIVDACRPTTRVMCDTDFDGVGDTQCRFTASP